MATVATRLDARASAAPAEWAVLPAWDGEAGTLWQVWMREKGAAYWLMKGAVKVANFIGPLEARLRGKKWVEITNPHALEDGGTYAERHGAEDRCRIAYRESGGRKA